MLQTVLTHDSRKKYGGHTNLPGEVNCYKICSDPVPASLQACDDCDLKYELNEWGETARSPVH